MMNTEELERILGVSFTDKKLLQTALTHRSFSNEHEGANNERLEFLGDAMLGLIVSAYLYERYRDRDEGELSMIKHVVVSADSCVEVAEKLRLKDNLVVSNQGGMEVRRVAGSALEAVIGAIYLDKGYETAKTFVLEHFVPVAEKISSEQSWIDPKLQLQMKVQEKLGVNPTYKILHETGPDQRKTFTIGMYLQGELISEGVGETKKSAEKAAARNALKTKNW